MLMVLIGEIAEDFLINTKGKRANFFGLFWLNNYPVLCPFAFSVLAVSPGPETP